MVYAAEVLERLARDVQVVIKNFSLAPTDNLHSGTTPTGSRSRSAFNSRRIGVLLAWRYPGAGGHRMSQALVPLGPAADPCSRISICCGSRDRAHGPAGRRATRPVVAGTGHSLHEVGPLEEVTLPG